MRGEPPHPLLFALALAALLGAAALLALRADDGPRGRQGAEPRPTLPAAAARRSPPARAGHPGHAGHAAHRHGGEDLSPRGGIPPTLARVRAGVEAAARRFLAAFLRYEVGATGGSVARRLRAGATEEFAAQLLAAPPRPRGGAMPARARLHGLEVALAGSGAVVSGSLRRGEGIESFALGFERSGGRWLAAAVVE